MWKTILFSSALLFPLFKLAAQKPVLVVPTGHSSGVRSVSCSADGKYFLTLGGDDLIKIWNEEGKELKTFRSPKQRYNSVKLSPDNHFILATHRNSNAWVLKFESGELAFTLQGHTGYIECEDYSPDGSWIATGAQDSTAILWNAKEGKLIRRFVGHQGIITALAFSPDGKSLATLSYDKTAKIWETATGKLLRTVQIDVHHEIGNEIHFSSDGKLISVLCRGYFNNQEIISLWSTETGEKVRDLEGYSFCFSPDGKWVCLFKEAKAFVYEADKMDGQPFRTFQATFPSLDGPMPTSILYGSFLPDSKGLLLNSWHIPEVYELETGKHRLSLKGYSIPVKSVSFSPDSRKCLLGTEVDLLKLDFTEGGGIKRIKGQGKLINSRYTPDGRNIVSITEDCTGTIFDADYGDPLFQLEQTPCTYPISGYARILEVSPDNQYFVRGFGMGNRSGPPMLGIGKFSSAARIDSLFYPFEDYGDPEEVAISKDGQQIAVATITRLLVWDVATRLWDSIFYNRELGTVSMAFYGKNRIAIGLHTGSLAFWDTEQKKVLGETDLTAFHLGKKDFSALDWMDTELDGAEIGDVVSSPNGKWLATAFGNFIDLWHCTSENLPKPVHIFKGHDDQVTQIGFSADSRYLISCSSDNTVRIWDVEKQVEVARIIILNQYNWAITTPSGLFDASPGAMEMMYFLSGEEVLELEQLKERYYEPGLISKVLGLARGELRKVDQFQDLPLYPKISAQIQNGQLNIQLEERNGGIGKLSLLVNGGEVPGPEDLNPLRKKTLSIDLKTFNQRFDTLNTIVLRAYNAQGWLKSPPFKLTYAHSGSKGSSSGSSTQSLGDAKPHLYALVVGTADYSGNKLDLQYADQDAASMAAALHAAGKELYGKDVHIRLFTTGSNLAEGASGGVPNEMSNKANIKAAFEAFAKPDQAQRTDVLVVYFSGHGITYGEAEKAQFYYLTKDIASDDLSDPEVRRNFTISSEELTEWIKNINAQKRVLILDACNSGKIVESLASIGSKDLNPSQIRAFDRMKDRTGMFILTGSAGDMVSYEASQYGQGLLTYSLLEGMSGVALAEGNLVDVMKLFQHCRDRVPLLAKSIQGIQTPVLSFPLDGGSIDIGEVNKNVKIPLAQLKPVFIRNVFQDEEAFEDVLGLGDALEQYFRQQNAKGAQSKLIYWDVKEYANAYSMKGRYTVRANDVEVRLRLFKGKTVIGEEFKINGKKDDLPGLVKLILQVVMPLAK